MPNSKTKSFVEALKAKYCDEDDGEDSSNIVSFVFTNRPRKNSGGAGEAELGYLTSMVLSLNGITHAGLPTEGLSSLCPNVTDLDLSSNLLDSWGEVIDIFHSLAKLKFVNLSGNKLQDTEESLAKLSDMKFGIENLVLNNTGISWAEILRVCQCLPILKELHVSKNGFKDIQADSEQLRDCFRKLEVLHITGNNFSSWDQVSALGRLPRLHTLMLSENPLSNIKYDFTVYSRSRQEQMATAPTEMCNGHLQGPDLSHQDMVDDILQKLIEDTVGFVNQAAVEATSPSQPAKGAELAYDSGMEDCQPHTPWHDRKPRITSLSSEDGDPSGLADSGFGCQKNGNDKQQQTPPTSQSLPDICEHSTESPSQTNTKDDDDDDNSMESDSSPHKPRFEYFEVTWDPDDEAIGHEEEEEAHKEPLREPPVAMEIKVSMEEEKEDHDPCKAFPCLRQLCVTRTRVSDWEDLEALRAFPKLESLRIKQVPFLKQLNLDERRKLLVASLPNIQTLNGSEVKEDEREKSERFFIRHFHDNPQPPSWIEDLVKTHGSLKPIVEVDLGRGFQEFARLVFIYKGSSIHEAQIRVVENVVQLRKYCAELINKPRRSVRMYHLSKTSRSEPHESNELNILHQDLLPMSRYDMADGDEIHIDINDGRSMKFNTSTLVSTGRATSFNIAGV